jgi:hypothetical protein
MLRRILSNKQTLVCRKFSSEVAKTSTPTPPAVAVASAAPKVVPKSGGSSFLQRLTSFLVGTGIGFGSSYYFIFNELNESNERFEAHLKKIDERLLKMEK